MPAPARWPASPSGCAAAPDTKTPLFFAISLLIFSLYSFLNSNPSNTNPKFLDLKKQEEKVPVFVCTVALVCVLLCVGRLCVCVATCVCCWLGRVCVVCSVLGCGRVRVTVMLMLWPFEYGGVLCAMTVVCVWTVRCRFFVRFCPSLILLCRLWFIVTDLVLGFVTEAENLGDFRIGMKLLRVSCVPDSQLARILSVFGLHLDLDCIRTVFGRTQ